MPHERLSALRPSTKIRSARKRLESAKERRRELTEKARGRIRRKASPIADPAGTALERVSGAAESAREEARMAREEAALLGQELGVPRGLELARQGVSRAGRASQAIGELGEKQEVNRRIRERTGGSPIEQQIQAVDMDINQQLREQGGFKMEAADLGKDVEEPLLFMAIDPLSTAIDGDLFDEVLDPVDELNVGESDLAKIDSDVVGAMRDLEEDLGV